MTIALLVRMFMAVRRTIAQDAFLVKRISVFARDSRDVREKRDWSEVSSSRVAPVAHVLLFSLTSP
jgi:hypothetical protein